MSIITHGTVDDITAGQNQATNGVDLCLCTSLRHTGESKNLETLPTLTRGGGHWSDPCTDNFTITEITTGTHSTEPQNWLNVLEKRNILPLPGIE